MRPLDVPIHLPPTRPPLPHPVPAGWLEHVQRKLATGRFALIDGELRADTPESVKKPVEEADGFTVIDGTPLIRMKMVTVN